MDFEEAPVVADVVADVGDSVEKFSTVYEEPPFADKDDCHVGIEEVVGSVAVVSIPEVSNVSSATVADVNCVAAVSEMTVV